jgi:hypothetical protein
VCACQIAGSFQDIGDKVVLLVLFDTTMPAAAIVRDNALGDRLCKTL